MNNNKNKSFVYISDEKKFIFVRVPKTASSSILSNVSKFLNPKYSNFILDRNKTIGGIRKHISAKVIKNHFPGQWDKCFTFGFVRNPYQQCVSAYYHFINSEATSYPDHIDVSKLESIDKFIFYVLEDKPEWCHWLMQEKMLFDEKGNQLVDFIGRFESLQKDYIRICDTIGIKHKILNHKNKRNIYHHNVSDILTDSVKSLISSKMSDTFKLLGYSK